MCNNSHEIWKSINGYRGVYQISNRGRVRNVATNIFKQLTPKDNGYLIVSLYKNNVGKTLYVHRLVLQAFVGNAPMAKPETRHLDGNKHNNNLCNLVWGNKSENAKDSIRHGTRFQPDVRGSKHGESKLLEKDISTIIAALNSGETQRLVAQRYGVTQSLISKIKRRTAWRHVDV